MAKAILSKEKHIANRPLRVIGDDGSAVATAGAGPGAQYQQIAHAMQEYELSLKSKRLRYGYILTALNIALRGRSRANQNKKNTDPINVYRAVQTFSTELKLLDSVDPQPDVFYNGVIAAGLIALTLHPVQALEFFKKLSSKAGSKREGKMDPIESVLAHIQEMKNQRSAWITAQQEELCGRTLRACMTWLEGEELATGYWTKSPARPLNYAPLITKVRKMKKIAGDQDL